MDYLAQLSQLICHYIKKETIVQQISVQHHKNIIDDIKHFYDIMLNKKIRLHIDDVNIENYVTYTNPEFNVYIVRNKNDMLTTDKVLVQNILKIIDIMTNIIPNKTQHTNNNKIVIYLNNLNRNVNVNFTISKNIQHDLNKDGNGLTTGGYTDNVKIIGTKRNGIIKLLIHELIHFFNLDSKDYVKTMKLGAFFHQIKVNKFNDLAFSEAITETLSVIINSLIYACANALDYHKIIRDEKIYSSQLVIKYFKFHGYHSISDIRMFFNGSHDGNIIFNSTTFMYIVVRDIIMFNLDTFIKIYFPHWHIDNDKILEMFKDINKYIQYLEGVMSHNISKWNVFEYSYYDLGQNKQNVIIKTMRGGHGVYYRKYIEYKKKYALKQI